MKRKRKVALVVETEQRLVLRKTGPSRTLLCEQCSGLLVLAEEAVAATGLSSRAIHRMVETGELHFAETPAGALLICLNSFGGGPGETQGEPLPCG